MDYYEDMYNDKAVDARAFNKKRIVKGHKLMLRRENPFRGFYNDYRTTKNYEKELLRALVKKLNWFSREEMGDIDY